MSQKNVDQPIVHKIRRPKIVHGETTKIETSCGHLYVTVNSVNDMPIEVFLTMGKTDGCALCQNSALGITISEALQHGVDIEVFGRSLRGITCPKPMFLPGGKKFLSCPDAISNLLSEYVKE